MFMRTESETMQSPVTALRCRVIEFFAKTSTTAQSTQLTESAGDQLYFEKPSAVSWIVSPSQIDSTSGKSSVSTVFKLI